MTTLSVPLPPEMIEGIEKLIEQGVVSNKAEAARIALARYLEDEAVKAVLKATSEPSLDGDLDQLAKKL